MGGNQLTRRQSSKKGEQHPVGGGEKHPSLDVGQSLFTTIDLEPQESGHEAQSDSLDPVQSG